MKGNTAIRVVLDIAMAAVLVAVMTTALVQEAPHEFLGVALFVLMVAHVVFNRRRLIAVFRGRRSVLRVLQIVALVGLFVCLLGQIASSLVLSKYAFGFLPALPGAGWARRVHLLCSYWMFVLAFVHAGLHARLPRLSRPWQTWGARIAFAIVVGFGAYSFVRLGLWSYLTGQVQFAAADFGAPLVLAFAHYASVAVLVSVVFHYVREGLMAVQRKRRAAEAGRRGK